MLSMYDVCYKHDLTLKQQKNWEDVMCCASDVTSLKIVLSLVRYGVVLYCYGVSRKRISQNVVQTKELQNKIAKEKKSNNYIKL